MQTVHPIEFSIIIIYLFICVSFISANKTGEENSIQNCYNSFAVFRYIDVEQYVTVILFERYK